MIYKKPLANDEGYLLLESFVTLSIATVLLIILYPLLVDWYIARESAKSEVEHARVLYEVSMDSEMMTGLYPNYEIEMNSNTIRVNHQGRRMDVEIYDFQFE